MTGPHKLRVRRACPEDYNDVMALNTNISGGLDYLPIMYHRFLQDKRIYTFVAEKDGKVVAYKAVFMDGSRDMVSIGSRVDARLTGSRIFGNLAEHVNHFMMLRYPEVELSTWCTIRSDLYEDSAKLLGKKWHVIRKWHCLLYAKSSDTFRNMSRRFHVFPQAFEVTTPNDNEAKRVLSDRANYSALFPSGYFVGFYNWMPRRICRENINELISFHRVHFSMETVDKCAAVSWMTSYPAKAGVVLQFHFYHCGADENTMLAHLVKHVKEAVECVSNTTNIVMSIAFPLNLNLARVHGMLEPHLGEYRADVQYDRLAGVMVGERVDRASRL